MAKKKTKKSRVSSIKKSNQMRNKLKSKSKLPDISKYVHQSKKKAAETLKGKSATNSKEQEKKPEIPPRSQGEYSDEEESDHGEDMLGMMEEDDVDFLKSAVGGKSYSMLKGIAPKTGAVTEMARKRKKGSDDEEDNESTEDVEDRYTEHVEKYGAKKTKLMLPIKTKHGLVQRLVDVDEEEEEEEQEEEAAVVKKEEGGTSDDEMLQFEDVSNGLDLKTPVSTAKMLALRAQTLNTRKVLIGVMASGLLEQPEEKINNFQRLLELLDEPNPEIAITVRKYAAVSLTEVFKDLLPNYKIKPLPETGGVLKKATLALQAYEKTLLKSYKIFLQKMENMASILQKRPGDTRKRTLQELRLGEIAVKCMCELLVMHPYFNFSLNVAQLLVLFLDNAHANIRKICSDCLRKIFKDDRRGELSLHIVRRINKMVKSKSHLVNPEVLSALLGLRIKEVNLDKEKEFEMKQKKFMNHKQKLISLSRKERKVGKQLEKLEKEMLETKAEENRKSKQQNLTEITKVVFTIYFRVLKKDPTSKLLSATLEGLAKFSHCINLEFFHDLVNVVNGLMEGGELGHREQLHCIQTVFTILSGQGDVLNIDSLRFYIHLYRNMLVVNAGANHADLLIVLRILDLVLIKRRKKLSHQRLLGFVKRLSVLATQVLHNGALGCLSVVRTVMQLDKSVDILLDTDCSIGEGTYVPDVDTPEYSNAANSALWELTAMQRHYHPTVSKFATNILVGVPVTGEGSLLAEHSKLSPEEMFKNFDPSEVKFNPSIPVMKKKDPRTKSKPFRFHSSFESSLGNDSKPNSIDAKSVLDLDFFRDWSAKKSVYKEEELTDELLNFDNQFDDAANFKRSSASTRSTISGKLSSNKHRLNASSRAESLMQVDEAVKSE